MRHPRPRHLLESVSVEDEQEGVSLRRIEDHGEDDVLCIRIRTRDEDRLPRIAVFLVPDAGRSLLNVRLHELVRSVAPVAETDRVDDGVVASRYPPVVYPGQLQALVAENLVACGPIL